MVNLQLTTLFIEGDGEEDRVLEEVMEGVLEMVALRDTEEVGVALDVTDTVLV